MSSNDMRKLMESIGNVDSLTVSKSKFGILQDMQNLKNEVVYEGYEGFDEDFDDTFNQLSNHLEKVSSLKKQLMDILRHASRSDPENSTTDFKRQELEEHLRFWLEEFSQIK